MKSTRRAHTPGVARLDAATHLDDGAAPDQGHRLAHLARREVVEEDARRLSVSACWSSWKQLTSTITSSSGTPCGWRASAG